MKRHPLWRRATAYVLAMTLAAGLLPGVPALAAGQVAAPAVDMQGASLLNLMSMRNDAFFNEHVRSDAEATSFNMIHLFKRYNDLLLTDYQVEPKVSGGNGLQINYGTTFTRKENGKHWTGVYCADYADFGPLVRTFAEAGEGELQYNLVASLKRDQHKNLSGHGLFGTGSDEARVQFSDRKGTTGPGYGQLLLTYEGAETDPNRTFVNYGDSSTWHPFAFSGANKPYAFQLQFGTNGSCTCGSSAVRNMAFALADTRQPKITAVTLTDGNGSPGGKQYLKAGETGYITLNFSEKIRFASQTPPQLGAYKLDLTLISRVNNQEVKRHDVSAGLTRLTNTGMVFQFTVPKTVAGAVTDHTIVSIAATQEWAKGPGDHTFPLTLYNRKNQPVALGAQSQKQEDLTKTSSLVTDMAGNPIDWMGSVKNLTTPVVIDAKAPTVTEVELSGAMMSTDNYETPENGEWPADIDRGAVFAGTGDSFSATVALSEVMADLDQKLDQITATFNLTTGSGPVTAKATAAYVDTNGTGPVTKLSFGPISANAQPPENAEPIRITQLTFPAGTADPSGNPIAATVTGLKNPKQQLWIDTMGPVVGLGASLNQGEEGIEPLRYNDGGDQKNSFYVPITVHDRGNHDMPAYKSQLENLTGSFALDTYGQLYRYAATLSAARPEPGRYSEGITAGSFTQAEGVTVYLHFQLIEGVPYNFQTLKLSVTARDYARNAGTGTWTLAQKADGTAPVITFPSVDKAFDSESRTGTVTISVSVADVVSNLLNVEYSLDGGDTWEKAPEFVEGAEQEAKFDVTIPDLADGKTSEGTLKVRAVDAEGNEGSGSTVYRYDLEKPAYSYKLGFDPDELLGNYLDGKGKLFGNVHGITISAPPLYSGSEGGIDKSAATTLFLLKDRLSGAENDYFVRTFTNTGTPDSAQSGLAYGMVRGSADTPDLTRWYHATYVQEGDTYTFTNVVPLDPAVEASLEALMELERAAAEETPPPQEPAPQEPATEEPASQDIASEETPAQETPSEETSVQETPAQETPSEETSVQETPAQETPSEETPVQETPAQETPAEETPAQETPAQETPDQDTPSQETSSQEKTTEEKTPQETPSQEPPAQEPASGELAAQAAALRQSLGDEIDLMAQVTPDELKALRTRLDHQYRGFYGNQKIILLTAYGDHSKPGTLTGPHVAKEELTYRSASYPVDEAQPIKPPHEIVFKTPRGPGGKEVDLDVGAEEFDPNVPGSAPRYLSSLAGMQIPFTIENIYEKDWGAADVDPVNSHIQLSYIGNVKDNAWSEEDERIIATYPIVPGAAEQVFTFPAELPPTSGGKAQTYQTGYYRVDVELEVSYAARNNSPVDAMKQTKYYADIYLYLERPDTFGLSDYDVSTNFKGEIVHTSTQETMGPPEGEYFTDVKLGTYEEADIQREMMLEFSLKGMPTYNQASVGFAGFWDHWNALTKVYWQIWNADDPNGEKNARFAPLGSFNRAGVRLVDAFSPEAYDPVTLRSGTYPGVPVLKGQAENTICFRFALQNGYISPVRQITAHVRGGKPTLAVGVSPAKPAEGLVNQVELTFDKASSPNGSIVSTAVFYDSHGLIRKLDPPMDPFVYTITENNTYWAVICDEFGNATAAEKVIDYVDGVAPIPGFRLPLKAPEGEFHYEMYIDDEQLIKKGRLFVFQSSESGDVYTAQGEVPILYDGTAWEAKSPQTSGVYYSRVTQPCAYNEETGRFDMVVEVKGAYPYLGEAAGATVRRNVAASISDDMGNRVETPSGIGTVESAPNQKPACTGVSYDGEKGLVFAFNTPVRVGTSGGYSRTLTGLPIYGDGAYDIVFQDLFGNEYTQKVDVIAYGGLGLVVERSETLPTMKDVTVTLAAREGTLIKSLTLGDPANSGTVEADGRSAAATVTTNDVLTVTIWDGSDAGSEQLVRIAVDNIDRTLEPVEVRYTYTAPRVGNTTTGDVIADLVCAEPIEGLNGETLSHTFILDGHTSHTFRYRDAAGNQGTKTVTCPATIVMDENAVDPEVPPDYAVELQQKRGGVYYSHLRHDKADGDTAWTDVLAALPAAQGYRLNFESPVRGVKLFVTASGTTAAPDYTTGTGAAIEGVSASGLTVTVAQNASFKVWLVDRWGNNSSLLVSINVIDDSVPSAKVEYVALPGGRSVRAYLMPNGTVTVTNRAGVAQETAEGGYKDKYYHDFTANGSFVFTFENAVGTQGTATATVSTLDTTAPTVSPPTWSGETKKPTNRPITAHFVLNKNIREVSAAWVEMKAEPITDYITVRFAGNTATVTYKQSAPAIKLIFTAPNGLTAEHTLEAVTNMDLEPPRVEGAVSVTPDAAYRSATISFTVNEKVLCAQVPVYDDQNEPIRSTVISTMVRENGTYSFHLTDEAGNTATVTAEVTGIDLDTLTLQYRKGAEGEPQAYAIRLGQLVDNDMVYVKPSKAATVVYAVDGTAAETINDVSAGDWAGPFTIKEGKKTYTITATDYRNESVSAFLNVLPPDTVPPVLLANRPTVPVLQNSTDDTLKELIEGNLTKTDDRVAPEKIVLTFNTDDVKLAEPGFYTATVTATDGKNSSPPLSVPVRVYGPEDLYADVGGELVFPSGTALVKGGTLPIRLYNVPGGEPYTIRYKTGYKTTGQMKIGATLVTEDTLTLEPGKYYTIYVRTQSRKELLFYVLAE